MTDQAAPPSPSPEPAAPGVATPTGDQPEKKGGAGKKVLSVVSAILIALVVVGLKFGIRNFFNEDKTADAKVGDCMVGQNEKDLKLIKCDDGKAEWKVAGRVEGKTEAEAEDADAVCGAYPTSDVAFWSGEKGGKGYVLCLEPLKA